MVEKNDFNMDTIHFSVLQEVGNIGAGNAVTSLSTMLGRKIDMSVPKVQFLSFKKVSDAIGGAENPLAAILIHIDSKHVNGMMMFLLELSKSSVLISKLMQREITELGEIEMSALKEIGNILSGAYLGALSGLLGVGINMSTPSLAIDMAGSILSVPAIEFAKVADSVLFIESVFASDEDNISGYFVLIPDQASFKFIFNSLGVEI